MLNGNSNVRRPFPTSFHGRRKAWCTHGDPKKSRIELLYDRPQQGIVDSPEWMFVQRCATEVRRCRRIVRRDEAFGKDASAADMPFGRFEGNPGSGHGGRWLSDTAGQRDSRSLLPDPFRRTIRDRSGRKLCRRRMIDEVPMFVVATCGRTAAR
jgi:hypothetical protein